MELTNPTLVKALLESHGFRFSKSMGQNFLIASWVPEDIAESARLTKEDGVLEIGPGIGVLTRELCERAGKVLSLELDERLRPILAGTLSAYDNVDVVFADAVKADLPSLCREYLGERPWHVCANLPYNVTTPLLTAFIEAGCFESITVMIQREAAARLCAAPGSADYCAFTAEVDWFAQRETLFDVSPDCFLPQPKVTSTVLRLTKRKVPLCAVSDERFFLRVLKAAFAQRRKALPNAINAAMPQISKDVVRAALEEQGLSADIRGEKLSALQFAILANSLLCKMNG